MAFPDNSDKITYASSSKSALGNDTLEIAEVNESDPLLPKKHHPIDDNLLSSRSLPWYKIPSAYWLLPTFFIISITYGLGVTSKVKFYVEVICRDYYSSEQENTMGKFFMSNYDNGIECNIPEVQARVSQLILVLNLCSAIPGVFVLAPLGSLSDRMGRRMILLFASVGMISLNMSIVLAGNFWSYFGTKIIIIGCLIDGFSGSFLSFLTVGYAYATDCTTPAQRNVMFGWIQGVMIIGFSLGPMLAGWIVEAVNSVLSIFYVITIIFVLLFLFVLFVLPESIPLEKRLENQKRYQDENHQRNCSSFGVFDLFTPMSILFPGSSKRVLHNVEGSEEDKVSPNAGKYSLLILVGINILLFGVLIGIQQIFLLYTSYVFEWSLMEQGYVLFFAGLSRAVVLMVIYPTLVRSIKKRSKKDDDGDKGRFTDNYQNGINATRKPQPSSPTVLDESDKKKDLLFEIWMIRVGLTVDVITYFSFGLITNSATFIAAYFFGSLGVIANPSIKSLQTNLVPSSRVGQLLGVISVLDSVTRIISPTIFNSLYILLVKTSPNLIWYGVSGMAMTGLALTFGISPKD